MINLKHIIADPTQITGRVVKVVFLLWLRILWWKAKTLTNEMLLKNRNHVTLRSSL
jgi:hypothetical protein